MQHGINLGHTNESAGAAAVGIVDILEACAGMDQKTIRCALEAFRAATSIDHTSISGCYIYGGEADIKKEA